MGTIYLLIFSNGKLYVGQTRSALQKRYQQHVYRATQQLSRSELLYHAWRKHGAPTVMMIDECAEHDLNAREIEAITLLGTVAPKGYNLDAGGSAKNTSPLTRAKLSKSLKNTYATIAPAKREAWLANVRAATAKPETRAKISAALKGRSKPPGFAEHLRSVNRCRKASVETRAKQRAAKLGKPNGRGSAAKAAAISNGANKYHGAPCKRGHGTLRWTSGCCVVCVLEHTRRYRAAKTAAHCPLPHSPQT